MGYMQFLWNIFPLLLQHLRNQRSCLERETSLFHKQVQLPLIEFYQTWKVDFQTLLIYGGVMALKLMYRSLVFALSDHRVIVGKRPGQCAFSKTYLYSLFSALHLKFAYIASMRDSYTNTHSFSQRRQKKAGVCGKPCTTFDLYPVML